MYLSTGFVIIISGLNFFWTLSHTKKNTEVCMHLFCLSVCLSVMGRRSRLD